jgi:hypothetical protein
MPALRGRVVSGSRGLPGNVVLRIPSLSISPVCPSLPVAPLPKSPFDAYYPSILFSSLLQDTWKPHTAPLHPIACTVVHYLPPLFLFAGYRTRFLVTTSSFASPLPVPQRIPRLLLHTFVTIILLQYAGRRAPHHASSVGSSKSVTAPEMAPTATRLPLPAMALPLTATRGVYKRMRTDAFDQMYLIDHT